MSFSFSGLRVRARRVLAKTAIKGPFSFQRFVELNSCQLAPLFAGNFPYIFSCEAPPGGDLDKAAARRQVWHPAVEVKSLMQHHHLLAQQKRPHASISGLRCSTAHRVDGGRQVAGIVGGLVDQPVRVAIAGRPVVAARAWRDAAPQALRTRNRRCRQSSNADRRRVQAACAATEASGLSGRRAFVLFHPLGRQRRPRSIDLAEPHTHRLWAAVRMARRIKRLQVVD